MRDANLRHPGALRSSAKAVSGDDDGHDSHGLEPPVSGNRGSALRAGRSRVESVLQPSDRTEPDSGSVSGGGQHASGTGSADGRPVRPDGGATAAPRLRFDEPVVRNGYAWWYIDALSDDGSHGLRTDAEISDAVCWNEQGKMPSVWRNQMYHLFLRLSLRPQAKPEVPAAPADRR